MAGSGSAPRTPVGPSPGQAGIRTCDSDPAVGLCVSLGTARAAVSEQNSGMLILDFITEIPPVPCFTSCLSASIPLCPHHSLVNLMNCSVIQPALTFTAKCFCHPCRDSPEMSSASPSQTRALGLISLLKHFTNSLFHSNCSDPIANLFCGRVFLVINFNLRKCSKALESGTVKEGSGSKLK